MDIDNIKLEYTKKINDRINKYKNPIIDSFVEFYGEENRNTIIKRFNDINFLYYINDITIFYIVDTLKNKKNEEFKNFIFIVPYIIDLIENNLYKCEIKQDNFYRLGKNKIVGCSNEELLKNNQLFIYSIAATLRENNEDPCEFNIPVNNDIKRLIALPIFSFNDKSLFHEINHAICSEFIIKNNEKIIKCGLEYSNKEKNILNEIINDMISLEIYNIFKSKCPNNIYEDNIMEEEFVNMYENYHHIVNKFYQKNKELIKSSIISDKNYELSDVELESLSKMIDNHRKK